MEKFLYSIQCFLDMFVEGLFHFVPEETQLRIQREERAKQVNKAVKPTDEAGTYAWLIAQSLAEAETEAKNWKTLLEKEVNEAKNCQANGDLEGEKRHQAQAIEYAHELEISNADVASYRTDVTDTFAEWKAGRDAIEDAVKQLHKQEHVDARDMARLNAAKAKNTMAYLSRNLLQVLPSTSMQTAVNDRIRKKTNILNAGTKAVRTLTDQLSERRKAMQEAEAINSATPGAKVLLSQMMSATGYTPTATTAGAKPS